MYYEEIGIDFATDCADANYLNNKGNVKFTRYLADYIKKIMIFQIEEVMIIINHTIKCL